MMTQTVNQTYIEFPAEWKHMESNKIGPFVTRVVHQKPDGQIDTRTSRRHRKGFGPEEAAEIKVVEKKRPTLFLWRPKSLNWWIAVLFMIGSWHFVSGSILVLAGSTKVYLIDLIYFTGSLFFTSAGYSQYYQSINAPETLAGSGPPKKRYFALQPRRIDFWATFPQFLGTLAFNVTTATAFISVQWLGYDLLVWVPDYVGSILFLISGFAGVFEFCHRLFCWQFKSLTWWIVWINFLGCIAFMISAFMAFVRPNPILNNLATWATIFTLVGAICFFVGAYLMWPEMGAEERAASD
ncbi:MAG: hypothetical protein ACK2UF_17595 [Candidatus Promineifilaceae bacterium]